MVMKRHAIVKKVVTACRECPFFDDNPHEPACFKLIEMNKGNPWVAIIGNRDIIDSRCPLPTIFGV
jgi:hypothetical protein